MKKSSHTNADRVFLSLYVYFYFSWKFGLKKKNTTSARSPTKKIIIQSYFERGMNEVEEKKALFIIRMQF
jgi:hypothetical protein